MGRNAGRGHPAGLGGLATVPLRPPGPSRFIGVVTATRRPRPLATALLTALRDTVAGLPLPA